MIILCVLPYKRRIYRFLYALGAGMLVVSSAVFLGMLQKENLAVGLEFVWLVYLLVGFVVTLVQLLANYQLFLHLFKYLKHHFY